MPNTEAFSFAFSWKLSNWVTIKLFLSWFTKKDIKEVVLVQMFRHEEYAAHSTLPRGAHRFVSSCSSGKGRHHWWWFVIVCTWSNAFALKRFWQLGRTKSVMMRNCIIMKYYSFLFLQLNYVLVQSENLQARKLKDERWWMKAEGR